MCQGVKGDFFKKNSGKKKRQSLPSALLLFYSAFHSSIADVQSPQKSICRNRRNIDNRVNCRYQRRYRQKITDGIEKPPLGGFYYSSAVSFRLIRWRALSMDLGVRPSSLAIS